LFPCGLARAILHQRARREGMFADDAYNKYVGDGPGTMVGNWSEERALRDATGEGRTLPQRHLPRSCLLKDFTRVATASTRRTDDTFERCYGPNRSTTYVPMSKTIGAGEEDLTGESRIALQLQADRRVERVGMRRVLDEAAMQEVAEKHVCLEEEVQNAQAQQRAFATTTGSHFQKPDYRKTEHPAFLRKSHKNELMTGRPVDRSQTLLNAGLDVQTNVHYSVAEPVTHMRMSLADP